ncbi:hypothetical protein AMECASPLE_025679 [Ameca splendens]|uniref:Inhibin alpha chain n=1 Tax=Ameca splendens TaxID=208324 RepID=A0ABV0Y599_9TELE
MVSCAVLVLGPLWIQGLLQACKTEKLPRGVVVSWVWERVLEGLGLSEPPLIIEQRPNQERAKPEVRRQQARVARTSRTVRVGHETSPDQGISEMILFPSPDSSCAMADTEMRENSSSTLTYHFQPSTAFQNTVVMSAHFWFYAGKGRDTSSLLFILTSSQQYLQAAQAPPTLSSDGWTTYDLDPSVVAPVAQGPFKLQIQGSACQQHINDPDKTPFLHLHVQDRAPVRSPREAPVTIPWSPSAIHLLQRPSHEGPQHGDCHREQVEISFEELGWDSWIVHPKVLTFYYCHGNCSAALLGIPQCCAPVPGTMRSLRITTTSDGGYSFKYETLPNIIPEECTCI